MRARIFVSYRRDDVAGDAGRLTDHLKRRFGKRRVFLDIDSIDPGIDFVQTLDASLQTTAAMLVVIGPRWASLRDANGVRRLDAPDDFVVREVAGALRRGIPVVPVLMQGAVVPPAADLPASIAPLATRQTVVIDHSEFHDDVARLCNQLAPIVGGIPWQWKVAAALVVALAGGLIASRPWRAVDADQPISTASAPPAASSEATRTTAPGLNAPSIPESARTSVVETSIPPAQGAPRPSAPAAGRSTARPDVARASPPAVTAAPATLTPDDVRREAQKQVLEMQAADRAREVDTLLAEAATQRGRGQFTGAMATLARARGLAPDSPAVRQAQEAHTIEWLRNVRFESAQVQRPSSERFQPTFGQPGYVETVRAALALVDDSLTSVTGTRRADLLAHAGWATYMLWTYGRASGVWGPPGAPRPDPMPQYREALAIDPDNPFANAMLAHRAFRVDRDLPGAQERFATALRTRREVAYVRSLQWVTFGTAGQRRDERELIRVANDMRRHGERLSRAQAVTLHDAYRTVASAGPNDKPRQTLLEILPADDHVATVRWAFEAREGDEESLRQTVNLVVDLLK